LLLGIAAESSDANSYSFFPLKFPHFLWVSISTWAIAAERFRPVFARGLCHSSLREFNSHILDHFF